MTSQPTPDVGGWFRTARDLADGSRRAEWRPTGDQFGLVSPDDVVAAGADLVLGRPTMVLTGAGLSTDSGLPDYRGRDAIPRQPMTYDEFVGSDLSRRRYWARSTVGWRWFAAARPNEGHRLLAALAEATPIMGVVTQNVDRLHQAAGSHPVVDLHGTLATVGCLSCGTTVARDELQNELLELNPGFADRLDDLAQQAATLPDGDAEVDRTDAFAYPDCPACGGILKPDVVFFGENARRSDVERAFELLASAEVLAVLGTSLSIMSGLRFVRRAVADGKPVVIVNDGATRGDDLATVRIHGRVADVLSAWLGGATPRGADQ